MSVQECTRSAYIGAADGSEWRRTANTRYFTTAARACVDVDGCIDCSDEMVGYAQGGCADSCLPQSNGETMTTDFSSVVLSLNDPGTWCLVGMSAGVGALGGIIHFAASLGGDNGMSPPVASGQGTVPLLPDSKAVWYREVLVGAVAAVGILVVIQPATGVALVSSSLIAGFAGQAITMALENRAKALIAQQAASVAQRNALTAATKEQMVKEDMGGLIAQVEKTKVAWGGALVADSTVSTAGLDEMLVRLKAKYSQ